MVSSRKWRTGTAMRWRELFGTAPDGALLATLNELGERCGGKVLQFVLDKAATAGMFSDEDARCRWCIAQMGKVNEN